MRSKNLIPIGLTIAGSDSGGGAGIQADLKTFAAFGVHGTSVITCVTAQNPRRVTEVQALAPSMVKKQIEAVFAELKPHAAKTGMLYSASVIAAVAESWRQWGRGVPLVVDPVMIATSGAALLKTSAVSALQRRLLPLATLITPNLDEVSLLTGQRPHDPESMRKAARLLYDTYGCAILVKGGHLRGFKEAVDIYWDGGDELLLTAPYVKGIRTHGTGCAYAAAVTAGLAMGLALPAAVIRAKTYITGAIANSETVRRHTVLNYFWNRVTTHVPHACVRPGKQARLSAVPAAEGRARTAPTRVCSPSDSPHRICSTRDNVKLGDDLRNRRS